uniref:Uncharacterized protein n=1 Tax=Siphoviridae sp. ctTnV63 TaxID=2825523 RepID=A0A8S5NV41_9CAUD|nr:MAG TPA: hypothetical protein [Siphoviridae sp. ctTnV63]
MTEKRKTTYVAFDGTEFQNKNECKNYENNKLLENLRGSFFYDFFGKPIPIFKMIKQINRVSIADLRSEEAVKVFTGVLKLDKYDFPWTKPGIYFFTHLEDGTTWHSIKSFYKKIEEIYDIFSIAKRLEKEKGNDNNDSI